MEWYVKVWKDFADFSGRARRREYWWFALVNVGVAAVLSLVDAALDTGFLAALYSLAVLVPGVAVSIRRLHDTGRPGWWLLIGLVPLVGGIVLLVLMLLDSEPGANRWGPSPKQGAVVPPPPAVA